MMCLVLLKESLLRDLSDIHVWTQRRFPFWSANTGESKSFSELPFTIPKIYGELILPGWCQSSYSSNQYLRAYYQLNTTPRRAWRLHKAMLHIQWIQNLKFKIQNLETHKQVEEVVPSARGSWVMLYGVFGSCSRS